MNPFEHPSRKSYLVLVRGRVKHLQRLEEVLKGNRARSPGQSRDYRGEGDVAFGTVLPIFPEFGG